MNSVCGEDDSGRFCQHPTQATITAPKTMQYKNIEVQTATEVNRGDWVTEE